MSLSLAAMATGCSAAAVSQCERAGQSIRRNLEATKQGMLALAQARGRIALSVVPLHCAYTYTQYISCQALSFAGGICARCRGLDPQSLHDVTDVSRNSWREGGGRHRSECL